MRLFELFELLVMLGVAYLVVNLVRYLFFRESEGGKLFGLSSKWIKQDEESKNETKTKGVKK